MRLSVLVLTHNRRAALEQCLDHIFANSTLYPKREAEVIVVNNGSDDGTREFLEERKGKGHNLIPINLKENGGVCERNHAINIARGEFIIQIDDDVIVHPGFDRTLLAPMEMDSQIGATGQHGFYQDATWQVLIDDRRRPAPGQYADLVMGFCWAWRNVMVGPNSGHGHIWERFDGMKARCGGAGLCVTCSRDMRRTEIEFSPRFNYDEAFNPFWHEESDLQMQIRAAGYRIMVVPEVATHRSLHDWKATMANEGPTAETQAERNFYRLKGKWQAENVRFEGSLVGLR